MLHRAIVNDYRVVLSKLPIKLHEETLAQCLQEDIFVGTLDLYGSDSVIPAHNKNLVTTILPKDM